MKRIFSLILIIFGVSVGIFAQEMPEVKKKVAVYMTRSGENEDIKKVMGAKLVSAITASKDFSAVERTADFLRELANEQDFQQQDVRDDQIVALGKKFGVKYVIVVDLIKPFEEYFITARTINVESALVVASAEVDGQIASMQQAITLADNLSDTLLQNMGSKSNRVQKTEINGHEYVDLGLPTGTKWAKCNMGAKLPEQYGDYYQWSETTISRDYFHYVTRQCLPKISGSEKDAATANWGAPWRLPSVEDIRELLHHCNWEYTTVNGRNGYTVTGPNGNSIFLPFGGYKSDSSLKSENVGGYYWSDEFKESISSETYQRGGDVAYKIVNFAICLYLNSSNKELSDMRDYYGALIRPVAD